MRVGRRRRDDGLLGRGQLTDRGERDFLRSRSRRRRVANNRRKNNVSRNARQHLVSLKITASPIISSTRAPRRVGKPSSPSASGFGRGRRRERLDLSTRRRGRHQHRPNRHRSSRIPSSEARGGGRGGNRGGQVFVSSIFSCGRGPFLHRSHQHQQISWNIVCILSRINAVRRSVREVAGIDLTVARSD